MKSLITLLVCVLALVMNSSLPGADAPYRHVVLFKFKAEATPDQVQKVEAAFRALSSKIDTIQSLEWGTNVSPENKNDGFTHCFFVTFKDKAGVDAYLPHPAHKEFGSMLRGILDKVLVIDYVARS